MAGGRVEEAAPDSIPIGSRVLVKPGDRIPLDGVVLSGAAGIDMSSLTGESIPVSVEKDGKVFSGAICLDGDLVIETTAVAADSMAGKILSMVEHAVAMKSRAERFITTFARYYTPVIALLAALVAALPPLAFGASWYTWLYRGLVLLVVACPCALFLSVPLAYFAGIGAASRHGILVKGGQVFDALGRAGTVIFDKTGTLTGGKLSLSGVETAPGIAGDDVLRLAALAESRSNHPVARAIEAAAAAAGAGGTLEEGATLRDVAGKGVVMTAPRGEILVGNAKLLREYGVEFTETAGTDMAAYVALNKTYWGCLTFADAIKKDSVEALARLRSEGLAGRLYMLTGDREETASVVAGKLGLDGFRAGLLPDGKVGAFGELSPDGRAVFVGDGVNDAPVLAAAGVGVAMGALGSAAAVEAADAVILDDSPARLPTLFRIAAKTRRIAGGNIAFALVVKAVIMALGVLGISGLWAAVFADVGVALIAVLNSLRLTRL
jgi:Cd2+/Zn2+-exporting ATPase